MGFQTVLATREKIIQGAVTLFVRNGVAKTTTREIAALSQVAEGSIYRYFPSKEELAWQVFRDYHHQLASRLQANADSQSSIKNKIAKLVECFCQMADEEWLMFTFYLTAQQKFMHKIDVSSLTPYRVILEIIEQGMQDGEISTQDSHILCAMAMGAVHQVAINKHYRRIEGSLSNHSETIASRVCSMVLQAERKK